MMQKAGILICGGGIVGLTLARELVLQGFRSVTVLEKEAAPGAHASGRMSGVLHSGVYYAPGSLRAATSSAGNRLMKEYCRRKGLPLIEAGKVIVARDEREARSIEELFRRAASNGATVEMVDEGRLSKIEPFAKTCGVALFCHDTAIVDPKAVLKALYSDLLAHGVEVRTGTRFLGLDRAGKAVTDRGPVPFGLFINAAGAWSDRVARAFGAGGKLRLVPFKGVYRKLREEKARLVRGNIYPVPDLRMPFLGVHFTRSASGEVYAGPTAMPALGRENYGALSGLSAEAPAILGREAALLANNGAFRRLALAETSKYVPAIFYRDARRLVKGLLPGDLERSGKSGIRPQLVDWDKKELVMDFLIERAERSIHIMNAISPAFTCSMEFARLVVAGYISGKGGLHDGRGDTRGRAGQKAKERSA